MVRLYRFLAIALGLLTVGTLAAGDAGKGLKYQFKPGETYTYTVTIVGELGAAIETTKGTIQFTVKSADSKQAQLTPNVRLSTQVKQPASTGKGFGGKKSFGGPPGASKGPFGEKGFAGPREITIDSYGKVLKFSGETSLPWLLGTAEEFVLEPLSDKGENRWQRDRDLVLREGQRESDFGPPRASRETNTAAKETATYDVAGSAGGVVTIKKTYDFKTVPQDGAAARIQLEGTADLAFDTQAGLIKTGEFKGAIVVTEKNVTFKIPVTASYRLMNAAEAAALQKQEDEARAKLLEAAKAASARRLSALAGKARPITIGKKVTGQLNDIEKAVKYTIKLTEGKVYVIDMISPNKTALDPFLHLLDASGKELAKDDDGGGYPNARITFLAPATANYQIVATTFAQTGTGIFTIMIKEMD